jgi:predicted membrane protein
MFLAAGVLLVGFNAGFISREYRHIVFSWPMLPVAVGFVTLFSRHSRFTGFIMMLIGGVFLLPKLNIVYFDFIVRNIWAIVLILIGVIIIERSICRRRFRGVFPHIDPVLPGRRRRKHDTGFIDRSCIFTGTKEKIDFDNFRGGEVNSVFGGAEIDLSGAQLAEGTNYLELNSVFGGITIYVPADWNIEIRQHNVFGDFKDRRPKTGIATGGKSVLIIEAHDVFGGGEIRCR